MFLRPVNSEGSYPGETKCIATTNKMLTHSPVVDWRHLGKGKKKKLNKSGRQKTRQIEVMSEVAVCKAIF